MFKLYRKWHAAQWRWIRNHPFQWFGLNASLIVVIIGYIEYDARRDQRKFEELKVRANQL
jgi:hypothetical protein